MSIYGTILLLDDAHTDDCAVWREVEDGIVEPSGECTCHRPWLPFVYEASHVLPADGVEMASINGEIPRREGEVPRAYEDHHPWLRLSVGGGVLPDCEDATVVLTEAQAGRMWQALGEWLGVPALSLEDLDALIELARGGIPGDDAMWEFSDHADALRMKLGEHRSALADAMERYEGSGS